MQVELTLYAIILLAVNVVAKIAIIIGLFSKKQNKKKKLS